MAFNKKVGERLTYEEVKEFAKSLGFCLLEDEYVANNIKMKMIEQSIVNSWKDVYELKENKQKSRTSVMDETIKEIYNGTIKLQ